MKIFIWKSYGDIEVYDVSTLENIKEMYTSIYDIVKDYGKDSIMSANESAMHYFLCSQALCPQDD